jgi:hypothetical protein
LCWEALSENKAAVRPRVAGQFALALPSIVFLMPHIKTIASLIVLVARAADKNRINDRKALIINMQKSNQQGSKAIVLVHGGFVDGSGWAGRAINQISHNANGIFS